MNRILYIILFFCMCVSAHAEATAAGISAKESTQAEPITEKQEGGKTGRMESESTQAEAGTYGQKAEQTGNREIESELKRTDILYAMYGGNWLQDSYLSMLVYDGWQAGLGNEWWTGFKKQPVGKAYRWRHVGAAEAYGGKAVQSSRHNTITVIGLTGGWGAHPYWHFNTGASKGIDRSEVELMVGPYIGMDLMAKELTQNVNKPYSFDLGIDAQLMIGASYSFGYKKTAYRLVYEGRMNGFGLMWLPDYWQSYYETTEKVNLGGSFAFSHPGNRQFIRQQLAMDIQLKKSTWRVGMRHEYLHYGDKNRHFARQNVSLTVGCIFNYKLTKTALTE